jgi:hypothetical protein
MPIVQDTQRRKGGKKGREMRWFSVLGRQRDVIHEGGGYGFGDKFFLVEGGITTKHDACVSHNAGTELQEGGIWGALRELAMERQ